MEDWGEEIFAEGVGVKWKTERGGREGKILVPHLPLHQPSTGEMHLITTQDGGIETLIYLGFRSKIMPALQAKKT